SPSTGPIHPRSGNSGSAARSTGERRRRRPSTAPTVTTITSPGWAVCPKLSARGRRRSREQLAIPSALGAVADEAPGVALPRQEEEVVTTDGGIHVLLLEPQHDGHRITGREHAAVQVQTNVGLAVLRIALRVEQADSGGEPIDHHDQVRIDDVDARVRQPDRVFL